MKLAQRLILLFLASATLLLGCSTANSSHIVSPGRKLAITSSVLEQVDIQFAKIGFSWVNGTPPFRVEIDTPHSFGQIPSVVTNVRSYPTQLVFIDEDSLGSTDAGHGYSVTYTVFDAEGNVASDRLDVLFD
jgi:hypothetical protein